jgi:dinuclear metal center YbgI/SA1388 family protein
MNTGPPSGKMSDMSVTREDLQQWLAELLDPGAFDDYGPNGLQIEGAARVSRVAFAVSATAESVAGAVEWGADALIVHHGVLWNFHGVRPLVGPFAKRVLPLVRSDINLFGYHLPLDANLEVGNAAGIARRLELREVRSFGDHKGMPTGVAGLLPVPSSADGLRETLQKLLDHEILVSTPDAAAPINSLGIITGGANGDWVQAHRDGIDAYLTGEMSEHDWHEAKESGVHMFAGGHSATEAFGVQDLMARLRAAFPDLETIYMASQNPA